MSPFISEAADSSVCGLRDVGWTSELLSHSLTAEAGTVLIPWILTGRNRLSAQSIATIARRRQIKHFGQAWPTVFTAILALIFDKMAASITWPIRARNTTDPIWDLKR
jgi:hypothetical protein